MTHRVLVTGGAGYFGCVLVRALLAAGWRVTVLDRLLHGPQPLLAATHAQSAHLSVIIGDVCNASTVAGAMQDCSAVVHLAGVVGYPACDADPEEAERTNVEGTRVVCDAVRARWWHPLEGEGAGSGGGTGVETFLFASTGSTYGKVEGTATEATPISPLTRYGRNKAAGEALVLAAGGTVLRFATLFGLSPRMRWDLLPNDFARRAVENRQIHLFDGGARRTFLHVEDAGMLVTQALASRKLQRGEVYNVGVPSGNLTKREVAEAVQRAVACDLLDTEGHDPDERDYHVSYEKFWATGAAGDLRSVRTLDQTLPELVQWARVWWRAEGTRG